MEEIRTVGAPWARPWRAAPPNAKAQSVEEEACSESLPQGAGLQAGDWRRGPCTPLFCLSSCHPYPHSPLVKFTRKPARKEVEVWSEAGGLLGYGAEAWKADRECPV